jgi:putative membrane protein
MRSLCLSIALLTIVSTMAACNQRGKNNAPVSADSISSADSLKAVNDSSVKHNTPMDNSDVKFVTETIQACITEAELGKVAMHNAANKRVKNFGGIMIKDLNKAHIKLTALASSKDIILPTTPDTAEQRTINAFAKKTGKDFDTAYVNYMISDHKNYILIFENQSKNAADPDIKKFATKSLRDLKNHLDAINTIHDSMN